MFLLHVELTVKPGAQDVLESVYTRTFSPAISQQPGFCGVALLRPAENGDSYRLSISFEDRQAQQNWVATDVHAKVWPQMENNVATYSVTYYYSV
jgi:heme-degrading monooxygenase HmoA